LTKDGSDIRLEQLQQRLGHRFSDSELLKQALTHRSAGRSNNERLEFLGDSLLNHVVAERLYHQFPDLPEGQMSRLRAKLVRGSYLAVMAEAFDLGECLILGTGERKSGGRKRDSILADALEAIMGALLLDSGFAEARRIISGWFDPSFAELSPGDERDAKTRLQEWLQGRGFRLPEYTLEEVSGADHEQTFRVSCTVEPLTGVTEGTGSNRRQAEQIAAGRALEELQRV